MSYNLEQAYSGFASYTAAGLAIGTTTGTFKTSNTLNFTNNGVFKSKAATDNLTFTAGHTTQGPIVTSTDPCPTPTQTSNNVTLVGLIKVVATAVFTPGTTALGTGNTVTYLDCARMPGSAQ